eukprot:2939843-Pyramimonas_sp.AAC.1
MPSALGEPVRVPPLPPTRARGRRGIWLDTEGGDAAWTCLECAGRGGATSGSYVAGVALLSSRAGTAPAPTCEGDGGGPRAAGNAGPGGSSSSSGGGG